MSNQPAAPAIISLATIDTIMTGSLLGIIETDNTASADMHKPHGPPTMRLPHHPEVIITGAGPAGVVVAIRLVQIGIPVMLIGAPRRFRALEGLAERALRALQYAGCESALASLGPLVQRQANWAGERFAGNREHLVERERFDAGLWLDASRAGVTTLAARVGRVVDAADHWQIDLPGRQIRARYWIEARGRAAPRTRRRHHAPPVTALAGWWQSTRIKAPMAGVLPMRDGWSWFAGLADGRLSVQLFIDSGQTPGRTQLAPHYARLISEEPELSELVRQAKQLGEPYTRYAHLSTSEPVIGLRSARVGDAALALDPLAGHGIFEALGSALALAPAVRTILQRPAQADDAVAFYTRRIASDFLTQARIGRDFYALENRWPTAAFWRARQHWPDDQAAHPAIEAGRGRISDEPVSVDGFIERRPVLVCPDQPRGVWQVGGVPLRDLLTAYQARGGRAETNPAADPATFLATFLASCPWPAPATAQALHWLDKRGLLSLDPG